MVVLVGIGVGVICGDGQRHGGDMVACALELASDIQKLLSSLLAWERLRAYNALLGNNGSVLLLVVASTMTSPPTIDGGLSFL